MKFASVEHLALSIGESLGESAVIVIDQARIDAFAAVTEDRQWIHVDPVLARAGPFGTTIAHGYLTLSLVSYFLQDLFQVDAVDSKINYGLNRVRFPAPVPVDSSLRATGEVLAVSKVASGYQADLRIVIARLGTERPVCVAEIVVLLHPSDASALT